MRKTWFIQEKITVVIPRFVKCLNYRTLPGPLFLGACRLLWLNDHPFAKASQISSLEPWPGYPLTCWIYYTYQRNPKATSVLKQIHGLHVLCIVHSALLFSCSENGITLPSCRARNLTRLSLSFASCLPRAIRHLNLWTRGIYVIQATSWIHPLLPPDSL